MRIRKLTIFDIEYKPLMKGLDLFFDKQENNFINANCFIGVNGSGKSQVLEIIAEIFLFLENVYRTENKIKTPFSPFAFRIEYELYKDNDLFLVIFECEKIKTKPKEIIAEIYKKIDSNVEEIDISNLNLFEYLPTKIIGYSSGDNETLSLPFDSYYDEYAEYTWKRAKGDIIGNDYEPNLYFMNYNTNLGIVISSLIFKEDILNIDVLLEKLNIDCLMSFTITIQTNQPDAPNKKNGGVILTTELNDWKEKLIRIADINHYDEKHKKNVLKYTLDEVTKSAFKDNFSSAFELYTCLYKLELLNNLIVDKTTRDKIKKERKARRLVTKMPIVSDINKVLHYSELKFKLKNNKEIDYLSFSDGEHQFLNVFGTISLIGQDNCLFLLDEPETHFNPNWRRTFISTLNKLTEGRRQDMFITSHSPFVVSDTKSENVFIFKRKDDDNIEVSDPTQETYGASFDEILKMAFDILIPISEESLMMLKELELCNDIKYIEEKIKDFGESYELSSLYRRIEFLKSNNN